MQCHNCGAQVSNESAFCGRCGQKVQDDEETYLQKPAPLQQPPKIQQQRQAPTFLQPAHDRNNSAQELERVIFTARPTLLFIGIGYAVAALCAILTTILLAYSGLSAPISLLVSLLFLIFPAYSHLRRNVVRYTLTDARVEIDRGFLVRTTRNIPLRNIQDVTVSASIFQRLVGLGDIIIDNASEQGGGTILRNIHHPRQYADQLLRELRRWQ